MPSPRYPMVERTRSNAYSYNEYICINIQTINIQVTNISQEGAAEIEYLNSNYWTNKKSWQLSEKRR